jgi:hypothetical protein
MLPAHFLPYLDMLPDHLLPFYSQYTAQPEPTSCLINHTIYAYQPVSQCLNHHPLALFNQSDWLGLVSR